MATCPTCQTSVEGDAQFCPRDGTPLIAPTDPLVGRLLGGRYRLVERLGQGGMGTVYKAMHTLMDKPVAVKILRGDLAGDPEAVARFHREARSASRLDHEHCIRVTDFGQSDDGLLYLVMELLDGHSLADEVARGAIEVRRACTLAVQIAQALANAHEHGVIHRDLKPDNVFLVQRRGREICKVLDFGLAKIAGEAVGGPNGSITKAGVVFGTPEYMAPEQAEAGNLDVRTDIYSFGVMLYQMLTGELPFRAPSFLALLAKQVDEVPEPLRQRRPDLGIPDALEAVVLRCMEKKPDARYQTVDDLTTALLPWADVPSGSVQIAARDPSPSMERALAASSGERAVAATAPLSMPSLPRAQPVETPSVLHGEVVPRRTLGRGIAIGVFGLAALGIGGVALFTLHNNPTPTPTLATQPTEVKPPPVEPLVEAQRLLDRDDLDGAERILSGERSRHDGVELQLLLGDLAQRRGNRLGALAKYYHATKLAPTEAEPHARLASLLALLEQRDAACREARLALARDAHSSAARAAMATAGCKEKP